MAAVFSGWVWGIGSDSVILIAALASLGHLLEMHVLRPHPRPTESETLVVIVSIALQVIATELIDVWELVVHTKSWSYTSPAGPLPSQSSPLDLFTALWHVQCPGPKRRGASPAWGLAGSSEDGREVTLVRSNIP